MTFSGLSDVLTIPLHTVGLLSMSKILFGLQGFFFFFFLQYHESPLGKTSLYPARIIPHFPFSFLLVVTTIFNEG